MLFDKNMSPGRNQACTSYHMPYAGWSGPIPSVNLLYRVLLDKHTGYQLISAE
jgi:hypothetical protein